MPESNQLRDPAPPSTEENGAGVRGAGWGVRGKDPAPRGRTRTQVLAGLVAGDTVSALARALGVHRSTIQEHRDALLATGALVVSGGRHAKGPAYALEGGAGSDRAPPRNATAPWVATDGGRVFEVLRAPSRHPTDMPGFAGTAKSGRAKDETRKRRDHAVKWTHEGRTFDLLLMETPFPKMGHGWSLELKKVRPAPYLSAIQGPGEDKEAAWDRFTFAAVQAWANVAGLVIGSAVRRSRPVSAALPRVLDPAVKWRSQDSDADGTPEPGTLEVRTQALQEAIAALPENQAVTGQRLVQLEARVIGLETLAAKEATIAERIVGVQENQARAVAATLEAIARPPSSLPLPPSSSPGVEYQ